MWKKTRKGAWQSLYSISAGCIMRMVIGTALTPHAARDCVAKDYLVCKPSLVYLPTPLEKNSRHQHLSTLVRTIVGQKY